MGSFSTPAHKADKTFRLLVSRRKNQTHIPLGFLSHFLTQLDQHRPNALAQTRNITILRQSFDLSVMLRSRFQFTLASLMQDLMIIDI